MKRLIFIALAITLAMGIVWVPSVGAVEPIAITIHKTIPVGGPIEDFTFEAWRDYNNNGIIDFIPPFPDALVGTVVITGAGTGIIYTTVKGPTIIHEVLIAGSAYEQQPDQIVGGTKPVEVTFNNDVQVQEVGEILILKKDEDGNALFGATFNITPDPKTGTGSLIVVDNGLNDELPLADGELLITGCQVCIPVTVTEIVAPPGYTIAPPQPAHVTTAGETVELTFVNTEEKCELTIYKKDESGAPLAGACFTITPDPWTGTDSVTVCDNDANDECSADGVFCLSELICGLNCTVEETTVPDGYEGAAPQTVIIGETLELTFVNTERTTDCGTVCAAQTAPSEFLFDPAKQENWFTWIYYGIGWGSDVAPYTYPIYTGQDKLCGTLYVYDNGTHIFVNYVLTDMDGCTLAGLSQYHLQVDRTFADLKDTIYKGKNAVPGKAEYKGTFDPMVSETGWIEAVDDDISGWTTAYIFAHGVGCYYCE
jgi:hypothetical protein